jgi:methyl-accepting chemotaxis protein
MSPQVLPLSSRPVAASVAAGLPLADASRRVEAGFLDAGERLGKGSVALEGIMQAFGALMDQHNSAELGAAAASLDDVATHTDVALAHLDKERQQFAQLLANVAKAERPLSELRKSVRMIGIVAINARVVAAYNDDADGIEVFTVDIRALSDMATKTIGEFAAKYQKLTSAITADVAQRQAFEALYRGRLIQLAPGLRTALAQLHDWQTESARGAERTAELTGAVSRQLGQAVMALQIGDATRQRLEHIEAALEDQHDPDRAFVSALMTLEAAQLASATRAFETETETAAQAITGIAAAVDQIAREGSASAAAEVDSPLLRLASVVEEAVGVLEECAAELQQSERSVETVREAVAELVGYVEAVQRIESEMRLVSLNAAIRCAQLMERGRALNVIALQLRELTRETVTSANDTLSGLAEASRVMSALQADKANSAATGLASVREEAQSAIARLGAADASMAAAKTLLGRQGSTIVHDLMATVDVLNGFGDVVEDLLDLEVDLSARGTAGTSIDVAVAETHGSRFAAYRKTYTMKGERDVFDLLLGITLPVQSADREEEMDDIFL